MADEEQEKLRMKLVKDMLRALLTYWDALDEDKFDDAIYIARGMEHQFRRLRVFVENIKKGDMQI